MQTERYTLLGRYFSSLSPMTRAVAGKRLNHILPYLESGAELTRKGFNGFVSKHPEYQTGSPRDAVIDFLYFTGVRFGKKRTPKVLPLKSKAEISERNRELLSGFMAWLRDRRDYSESSLNGHYDGVKAYFKYADTFDQETCRRFIATLEEQGKAPQTINMRILSLKFFGEYLRKPIDIRKRKMQRKLSVENVPTAKEYQDFLAWLRENDGGCVYWMVRLLGSTGMRRSELMKITWGHVCKGEAYIKCKGSKYRTIYFPKPVRKEAEAYVKENGINTDDIVVLKADGEKYSERGIDFRLKRKARKAGYPEAKAHCHAFRHFFAKMYLKKSADVVQLAELMGHESVDTTRIYLQKSKEEHANDVNRNVVW